MHEARRKAILESLDSQTRKIYEVVPANEPWSVAQILAELYRLGLNSDRDTTIGCLYKLCNVKLVRQPDPLVFKRAPMKGPRQNGDECEAEDIEASADMQDHAGQAIESQDKSALIRLGIVANSIRALAEQLDRATSLIDSCRDQLAALAHEAEEAAIEAEQSVIAANETAATARQLRELLARI